jgi:molybdopterin/thiamine biosynthesis adenylyltransferase
MNELVFGGTNFANLKVELLRDERETAAFLLANRVSRCGTNRLLVRETVTVPPEMYRRRTPDAIEVSPALVANVAKQALRHNQSVIFVHTHPSCRKSPEFSSIDDCGERNLADFFERRIPNVPHASLIVAPGGCCSRFLGTQDSVRVTEVGQTLLWHTETDGPATLDGRFDRQVRAFGAEGQSRLQQLRVGIVGLGGTGATVAEQLSHLGVEKFLFVDPDIVEESNLNRIVGASANDVGRAKVDVAEAHAMSIRPCIVEAIHGSVVDASIAKRLTEADFLFCCTDSYGSRAILCQIAYQYLIPCIDVGVGVSVQKSQVTHITGRVQMLTPGLSCLTCSRLLDADAVRRDLQSNFERATDPYFTGAHEPQPSIISINGCVVSLAVTMFLAAAIGIPGVARYQLYNAIQGTVRPVIHVPDPHCVVCSLTGALGRGDEWPLLARYS